MSSFAYDVTFLQRGIPELQSYLLSNEIYWPLGLATPTGGTPYPRMTLGWLLLAKARARGWVDANRVSSQANQLESLARELDQVRARWRVAWNKKAAQEFSSRLKLWADFLNEYRGDKAAHARRYRYEVQRRVMLDLLAGEADPIPKPESDLLQGMDSFLRAALKPGAFVWEEELTGTFPPESYWYLYGNLPTK